MTTQPSIEEKITLLATELAARHGRTVYIPRHGGTHSMFSRSEIDRDRASLLLLTQIGRGNYNASRLFYALFGAQYAGQAS